MLVTRQGVLKLGMALMYQTFKIRVGCGYRGIILVQKGFALVSCGQTAF